MRLCSEGVGCRNLLFTMIFSSNPLKIWGGCEPVFKFWLPTLGDRKTQPREAEMSDALADELTEDSRLAWELFDSSNEAGEPDMACEYRRLAMDAEGRLASMGTELRRSA